MYFIINLSFHFKKVLKIIKYLCIAFYCFPPLPKRIYGVSWIITFIRIFSWVYPEKKTEEIRLPDIRKFCALAKVFILHRDIWKFSTWKNIWKRKKKRGEEKLRSWMEIIIVIKIYFVFLSKLIKSFFSSSLSLSCVELLLLSARHYNIPILVCANLACKNY